MIQIMSQIITVMEKIQMKFNVIAKYWTFIISSEDPDEILDMTAKYLTFIICSEHPDEIFNMIAKYWTFFISSFS